VINAHLRPLTGKKGVPVKILLPGEREYIKTTKEEEISGEGVKYN